MSSGGKGRSNKGSKGGTDRSSGGGGSTHNHQTKSDHNHNEREKDSIPHKIAPTAEQLRIAQMIDNTHSEKVLHEKISQVVQVTGVSTDDAIVALHDCDNDVNAAIDSLLEGEDQGEWRESTKKKKKAPAAKQSKEEAESNKENRRVENRERSGSRPRGGGAGGPPRFRGRGGGRGGREETSEGIGRGSGGRRGRMANGTGPPSRGRGSRGRGSNASNRTFQKRQSQPPGFTETIDTWSATPEKIETNVNSLQIDTWDDEQRSSTTEDWDSEWTGSLDKTTVFSPSTSMGAPSTNIGSTSQQDMTPIIQSGSNHSTMNEAMSSVLEGQANNSPNSGSLQSSLSESVGSVLSMGPSQLSNASMGPSQLSNASMGPSQLSNASMGPSQLSNASMGPSQLSNASMGPSQLSSASMGPSQLSNASMGPSQLSSASMGPSQLSSASMGPSQLSSASMGPSQLSSASMGPSQLSSAPMGQSQLSNASMNAAQSYSNVVPSPNSITQSQAIDLAALLQKAAPHSTLTRLPPTPIVDSGNLVSASLGGVESKNILSGISSSVGDSLKSSILVNSGGSSSVSSSEPQSYSPSATINNSMFSNSVSNLGSSLNNSSGVNKVLSLSSQNASLASRAKPQRSRMPHSSKIPSKAVEMPEVAMAALDMQFTGLEFGTETFDFTSEVKPLMGPNMVSGPSVNTRDPSSVPVSSVSKDLSGLSSTMSQPPQSLGPQPIPFPSQASERKPPQSSLLSGPQRASAPTAPAQNLADLTKKDTASAGGPSLGSLVGQTPSGHSPYQSSASTGYGPKASSFPSPPAHYTQNPTQSYSSNTSSGVSNSNYAGAGVNNSSGSSTNNNSTSSTNPSAGSAYGSGYSTQGGSVTSGQYQNNYVNVSSHSLASMNVSKTHASLKESSQSYNDATGTTPSMSGSLSASAGGSNNGSGLSASMNASTSSSVQPSKASVPGKTVNSLGSTVPPGVQQHSVSQQQHQQQQQQQMGQHHSHHHLQQQQQQVAQQTQQTQQLMAGPSQYVSPQQAALQGALPPPFYNVQQPPAMYSFEDLQLFQQRITHMPQAPTSLPGSREANITSPPSYSVAEANKFRTDQNSSPVPSTINQQGAAAGATYITAPGNAGIPPFYMYQTMPAVPNTFSQYGTPAIIQIPSNTHTGSTTTQFPGPPKLPYGGTSNYYDTISQTQDYKAGYGTGSQGQNKAGPNSSGSATNSGSDLTYKNHLSKVNRTYEKQTFHTGTPPPFNLAGSGTNPMAANYTPMFIPTMPAAAQHHTPMMHHQLHQDTGSSAGQRTATGGAQNKGGSKASFTGSYWGN